MIFAPNATLRGVKNFMQHPPGASAGFYQIDRVAATTQQKGSLKAGVANLRCNKPAEGIASSEGRKPSGRVYLKCFEAPHC